LAQWSALVPEAAFHPGKNEVHCYQVQEAGSTWTLTPCHLNIPHDQDS
jgi:hypothetical protein